MNIIRAWCIALMLMFGVSQAYAVKPDEPQIPTIAPRTQSTPTPAASAQPVPSPAMQVAKDYVLAVGDTVNIEVFGEAELSREYTVGNGGTVSIPLIGETQVAGLRTKQVEQRITTALKKGFLINPRVTVTIRSYRSVYVSGQVRTPGGFPYLPGMTVRKLVSLAGGFTERASKSRIYVISENASEDAKPRKIKLDGEVKPGDVVSIEESFF